MNTNKLIALLNERSETQKGIDEDSEVFLMLIEAIISSNYTNIQKRSQIWLWVSNNLTTVNLIKSLLKDKGIEV